MGVRKRFDRDLYEKNDALAKKKVKDLLKQKFTIMDNPKKKEVDLLIYNNKGEHIFNVECEIKRLWKDKNFQYESVQFPTRKEKYAKLDKPTLFVMFNDKLTHYLCVTDKSLLKSPKVEVPNRFVFKGEFFFQVSLTDVIFNDILKSVKEVLNEK